jgi:hypothetical protein
MQTSVRRDKEGHYILIKGTIQHRYDSPKIYTPNTSTSQVHKINTSELEGKDRTRHNNSGRSQHPTFINRQNIQTKN